ncbi:hypothetical protein HPB50_027112 [Hyalomma asiaticum]|uniref:Uncharacterized protein n=1 Tax=Hyalomma asiaticum TaxID=266040 RepID=A0ACB7SZJ4_HYAAI|nr:hypothetical protein HPB50_027112 [Hyalomma asiaticum]
MDDPKSRRGDELQGHLQQHCCRAAPKFFLGDPTPSPHSRRQGFLLSPLTFRRGSLTEALPTRPLLAAVPCLVLARPCTRGLRCRRLQAASFSSTRYSSTFTRSEAGRWALLVPLLRWRPTPQSRRSGDDDASSPPPSCKRLRCGLFEPGVDGAS